MFFVIPTPDHDDNTPPMQLWPRERQAVLSLALCTDCTLSSGPSGVALRAALCQCQGFVVTRTTLGRALAAALTFVSISWRFLVGSRQRRGTFFGRHPLRRCSTSFTVAAGSFWLRGSSSALACAHCHRPLARTVWAGVKWLRTTLLRGVRLYRARLFSPAAACRSWRLSAPGLRL